MEPRNYLVASIYTNPENGKVSTMSEVFHADLDSALADYTKRNGRNGDMVICKVLTVKTVVVDYDAAGQVEKPTK
jgi:hypothetical protein